MRQLSAALPCMLVAGCAALDRPAMSEFTPLPDGRFEYRVAEAVVYSQRERIAWLERYLADNDLCPDGYEIDRMTRIDTGAFVDDLLITGRCVDGT